MAKFVSKVSCNKCRIDRNEDGGFNIVELDKDYTEINVISFDDFVHDFLGKEDISITISHNSEF